MVQLAGTYAFVSSDKYAEYLSSFGLTPEQVAKASQSKSPVVVKSADDKQITMLAAGKEVSFAYNKEIDHTLPTGHDVKTVASLSGDTVTFKSKTKDGAVSEERVLKFTDNGLTSVSKNSQGAECTRVYKRE